MKDLLLTSIRRGEFKGTFEEAFHGVWIKDKTSHPGKYAGVFSG